MAQHNMNSVFYATTYHPIQAGSIDGTDTASHDNGVYRALVASSTGLYDPTGDAKAEGDPYCTLFVGRLAHHTTEKTLHEVMSKYGRVKHLRLVRHIVTGASRGYAFVEFESEYDMQNAYEVAQHDIIDGSSILVDYNRQQLMPGWIPRRLGGGLGGRKESGQLRFGGRDRPFRAPLRTIPSEQLAKLGIPLPPVGRYMSRFQLPPIPRRPGSSKEGAHHRQKSAYRRSPTQEGERAEKERRVESSSRQGTRSIGAKRESSTHEHRSRQRAEEGADRDYEDEKQHRKRRHSDQEDEHVDREKSSWSSHGERESSRHRDPNQKYLNEHKKIRPSDQGDDQVGHEQSTTSGHDDRESILHEDEHRKDRKKRSHSEHWDEQVDHEKSTRSGHEGKDSSRRHERSRHKHRESGHHESSTSKSRHKDRDGGLHHKRDRSTQSRASTAEYAIPPRHESEQSRHSQSKQRRKDD